MSSVDPGFIKLLKRRVAMAAIGPNSLRNQGAPGVIKAARDYLEHLDPSLLFSSDARDFPARLDRVTRDLETSLPEGARSRGAARKALNLFLRDLHYHTRLAQAFGLLHS